MVSFDHSPIVYWFLSYALAVYLILALGGKRINDFLFLILAIVFLALMRLPGMVLNRELNPDESQMLGHAITLYSHPVYWKSVDGTTIGPLDNYILLITRLLVLPLDYFSARLVSLFCLVFSTLALFAAVRSWLGSSLARGAALAFVFFFALTQEADFVNYSSEQLPLLLLSFSLYLFAKISTGNAKAHTFFLLGFTAGAVPFAKLQAVPLAALIALSALVYVWFKYPKPRLNLVFLELLGGITIPLVISLVTLGNGTFGDMIDFYLLGNAIYAGDSSWLLIPGRMAEFLLASYDFLAFSVIISLAAIVSIIPFPNKKTFAAQPSASRWAWLFMLLLFLCGIYAVTKSGNIFVHYLHFLVLPLVLLATLAMQKNVTLVKALPAVVLLWFLANDASAFLKTGKLNEFASVGRTVLGKDPVVRELGKYTSPGDQMVVWGWQCRYYVEAQLPQGTAESHSERSIYAHPLRERYRERYISDMRRNKPTIFIDATGPNSWWLQDSVSQSYRSFPALRDFIDAHYAFKGNFDGNRLFVREK